MLIELFYKENKSRVLNNIYYTDRESKTKTDNNNDSINSI